MSERKIALVSGGNRSIGFEVVRSLARLGMIVYLGSRDEAAGEQAAESLKAEGEVHFLSPMATVLGLFSEWDCTPVDAQLVLGDALVMYTRMASPKPKTPTGRSSASRAWLTYCARTSVCWHRFSSTAFRRRSEISPVVSR